MANLPLLFFPQPTSAAKRKLGGGGASHEKPSAAEQRQRLDGKFRQIAQSFHSLQGSPQGLAPEQVIVLETIGDTVENVARAAEQIPGLEWLAEMDLVDVPPEVGFTREGDEAAELTCRLYAVVTNQQAIDRLIALWDDWCNEPSKRARPNFGPFKNLFINLRDVRRWGATDRIAATGVLAYLQKRLDDGIEEIRFEIELWCRRSAQDRIRAFDSLSSLIAANGGECVRQCVVPEVFYHGVLVKMPANSIRQTMQSILQDNHAPLIRCEDVMFFRPFAQAGFACETLDAETESNLSLPPSDLPKGDPIIAILDGLPLEHHSALDGRLIIDDPQELARQYAPGERQHGTAMASLVVHGDLNAEGEEPLGNPVHLRPILIPKRDVDDQVQEVVSDNELL